MWYRFLRQIVPETIMSTMKFSSPTETSIRLQGKILKVQQNITSSPLHAITCPRSGFQGMSPSNSTGSYLLASRAHRYTNLLFQPTSLCKHSKTWECLFTRVYCNHLDITSQLEHLIELSFSYPVFPASQRP